MRQHFAVVVAAAIRGGDHALWPAITHPVECLGDAIHEVIVLTDWECGELVKAELQPTC